MLKIIYLQQVTLSMYFRQQWTDGRLTFRSDEVNSTKSLNVTRFNFKNMLLAIVITLKIRCNGEWVIAQLDAEQVKKIWMPDTFIVNERSVVPHNHPNPNEFTRVFSDGKILRSMKYNTDS